MDITLKEIIPAVTGLLGGAGGVLVSAWKVAAGFKKSLDTLRTDLDNFKNTHESQRSHAAEMQATEKYAYTARLDQLDRLVRELQEDVQGLVKNETFQHFTEGQQTQWLTIQRTIGSIEGILKKL